MTRILHVTVNVTRPPSLPRYLDCGPGGVKRVRTCPPGLMFHFATAGCLAAAEVECGDRAQVWRVGSKDTRPQHHQHQDLLQLKKKLIKKKCKKDVNTFKLEFETEFQTDYILRSKKGTDFAHCSL